MDTVILPYFLPNGKTVPFLPGFWYDGRMQQEETKKKPSRRWLTVLFVAFNVAVIAVLAISEYQRGQGADNFRDIELRWGYLAPAIFCAFGAIAVEIVKYMVVMKSVCGRTDFHLCRRTVLLGRYYDNITPSGIGGQPYQVYYMNKQGLSGAESLVIPVAGFLTMQFAFIIFSVICIIFGGKHIPHDAMRAIAVVGTAGYAIFPVAILLFAFVPAFAEKITRGIVGLLAKLRIVKDREQTAEKFSEKARKYSEALRQLLKKRGVFAVAMVLGLLYQFLLMSVPYFVIHLFGGNVPFLGCFITVVIIYGVVTFMPTPGNSGAAEGVFYAVFASLSGGYIYWAMLFWRFLVYYVFIIYGVFSYLVEFLKRRRRRRHSP